MANPEIRFLVSSPNGHIDDNTSASFRTAFDTKLEHVQAAKFDFVIDLSSISYMSSIGIRELVRAQKQVAKRGGRIILDMVDSRIEEKLRLTGLETLLPEKQI